LSGAYQSIITAGFAELLDELVHIGIISHFVFQSKLVFHHLPRVRFIFGIISFWLARALINFSSQVQRVALRFPRCTPNTRYAMQTAATLRIVKRAVHLAPSVTLAGRDSPALVLRMLNRRFNFFVGML